MVFSKIDESAYDEAQVVISYCKLFPFIVEDFLSRLDCNQMMIPTNLIAQVDAGQLVATAGSPTAQTGSTVSPGQGRVNPLYRGDFQKSGTKALAKQKKALKEAGGIATQNVLDAATQG